MLPLPRPATRRAKRCTIRQGPSVCELDGPTPMLKMSNALIDDMALSLIPRRASEMAQKGRSTLNVNRRLSSVASLTMGKPKSNASGTGLSWGTAMRTPRPAETR